MREWLSREEWDQAVLVWATDHTIEYEDIEEGLSRGLPLLAPEDNGPLRDLCISYDCGLFYRNVAEALAALRLILDQSEPRHALGARALRGLAIAR